MHRTLTALVGAGALVLGTAVVAALPAAADAPSGAIFTTLPDGSEVNFNIYSSKDDVYLDGGPCSIGEPSTIVDLTGPAPMIVREGAVTAERVGEVLGVEPASLRG